jgi:starch phosphorylase
MTIAATTQSPIAYFSAEFAIESNFPIYAGGLGVLAGDILKQAADLGLPMIGVGLLYKGEEARQVISPDGQQIEENIDYRPEDFGLELMRDENHEPLFVKVHLTQVDIWLQLWRKRIGQTVDLYLLDPDNSMNHSHERRQAFAIYAGTQEEIIKQQLILGIGGVKALHALNIKPCLYHINEGRPSFLYWQVIRQHMELEGKPFTQAVKLAKQEIVYTNHTVVKAGNQTYDLDMMKAYCKYYAQRMGISIDQLLKDGTDENDRFDVTLFALNSSSKASSVSQPHFQVCKKNWPKYNWVNVTNGVHHPTWIDNRLHETELSDENLWRYHLDNKRITQQLIYDRTGFNYDSEALIITWARRFASYKQPNLIFENIEELQKILLSTARPVQLIIAGKAHVFDQAAKRIIRELIGFMSRELRHHALFVPNYNMEMGIALTRGSDVWLNTPKVGQEASGTSGMKAIANGVLQLTTVDGWTAEVDWSHETAGWALPYPNTAESFFYTMNEKVLPLFYQRNSQGIPHGWLTKMRAAIKLSRQYSAKRMMEDYQKNLYPQST